MARRNPEVMKDVDLALNAYLTAMLWSSVDDNEEPLDNSYSISDISVEAVRQSTREIDLFFDRAGEVLMNYNPVYWGHDLWMTRNRHGTGFWDGDYEKADASYLTTLAHEMGERYVYVGDDGLIYISK